MRLRTRVSDADSTAGGSPTWYGRSNGGYQQRMSEQQQQQQVVSEDEGEVDLLVVGQQMGRVGQEDAAVDKALEQVGRGRLRRVATLSLGLEPWIKVVS
jgi:hypothetical protein